MAPTIGERELSDPLFHPVYERIQALSLPIFLHPVKGFGAERLTRYYFHNAIGYPLETAVAAAELIFGGVLDAFPTLQICLPHAGGALPLLIGRLDHAHAVRPEARDLPRAPHEYLTRFWYDTITHSAGLMKFVIDLVGLERIVLGSDYCFNMGYAQPVEELEALGFLTEADRRRIAVDNARTLLRI
jgi:aminocarboxymuconate-semialdehyde decarboxylase